MSIGDSPVIPGRVLYRSRAELISDLELYVAEMLNDHNEYDRVERLTDAASAVWLVALNADIRRRAISYYRYEAFAVRGIERTHLAELLWEAWSHVFSKFFDRLEAEYVNG